MDKISRYAFAILGVAVLVLGFFTPVLAQQDRPAAPTYIVQEGDSLWGIAARFGVSVNELQSLNQISDANQLRVGDQLKIPGLEGIAGVIVTTTVPFGETDRGLERRFQVPADILIRLNRLTSPRDLFVGWNLIMPQGEEPLAPTGRDQLKPDQSILEFAILNQTNPWAIADRNMLSGYSSILPGDVLRIPGGKSGGPGGLPNFIQDISVIPGVLLQGKATEIAIKTDKNISLEGTLLDQQLNFYPDEQKGLVALQGVHAMTEPGVYPLSLKIVTPDDGETSFVQMVPVRTVDYPYDQPLAVDPATIDPAVTKPEDAQWIALTEPSTPEKYWNGIFQIPSPLDGAYCLQSGDCWSSRFGNRRSYNGSAYTSFHTGLDIVGKTGTDIYAPAAGQVVFAGPLTVRGNATMINHGLGVYTGYMHQSEIFVKPGDFVQPGQLIGKVGGTGRVQGPHLHWEVWVGGVQVDPLDWLETAYP